MTQDPPSEFLAPHRESTALSVGQATRSRAKLLTEDPILLPEIVDSVFLVAVHPASDGEYEELESIGHALRLLGVRIDHASEIRDLRPLCCTLRGRPGRRGCGTLRAAKHGGRGTRGWKKLHVGVDHTGVIVTHALTEAAVDDATTGIELIEAVNDDIMRVTADAAYDTVAFYDAAGARGATVVVPPAKTARVSRRRPRSRARDRTINTVKSIGRRRWKKTSRYHKQARVENAFFRYKSIIGDGLRARTPDGRAVEVLLACNMLNAMTDIGRPVNRTGFVGGLVP